MLSLQTCSLVAVVSYVMYHKFLFYIFAFKADRINTKQFEHGMTFPYPAKLVLGIAINLC